MVQAKREARTNESGAPPLSAHVMIFEARFYTQIADLLADGAIEALNARGVTFERVIVPGALEIPQAFAAAARARRDGLRHFDGAIAIGCVIRGETAHYDIVCNNSNHFLMEAAIDHGIPVGNAILTVENERQAIERAEGGAAGKGGDAARACLALVEFGRALTGGVRV